MATSTLIQLALSLLAVYLATKIYSTARIRAHTTKLPGPPSANFLLGASKTIFDNGSAFAFEQWERLYGQIFQVPLALGSREIVILDPKAISHVLSKDAHGYVHPPDVKRMIASFFGKGLMWSEGERHRTQRRVLNPFFSVSSARGMSPVFLDSAYKVKAAWDTILLSRSSGEAIIDISKWMNAVSLDNIGIAAFGYDFGCLDGHGVEITQIIDSFSSTRPQGLGIVVYLLSPVLPFLDNLSRRKQLVHQLNRALGRIATRILQQNSELHQSILHTLQNTNKMSAEEVLSQVKVLVQAGYETTAISLTWALIELARNPERQDKLRQQLLTTASSGTSQTTYLSAVVREIIRLYPPVGQAIRVASQDDVVPLSNPIVDASGTQLQAINIAKGSVVNIPLRAINLSDAIWGPDAKSFVPERWLDDESGLPARAKEIPGYHHVLTFIDGPRTCLGRNIALEEIKSILQVLIRHFVLEMRDGPTTNVEKVVNLFARPKVAGEEGYAMPIKIRHVEG